MADREIVLHHNGYLKYETIGEILGNLKTLIEKYGLKVVVYKKVLSVTIETLENMYKYYLNLNNESIRSNGRKEPEFMVEKTENEFIITSGNILFNNDVVHLNDKLEMINKMSRDEVKEYYKEIITNGEFSKKGGAGLGFVEMAKVSGQPLAFTFDTVDDQTSYFNLQVKVSIN